LGCRSLWFSYLTGYSVSEVGSDCNDVREGIMEGTAAGGLEIEWTCTKDGTPEGSWEFASVRKGSDEGIATKGREFTHGV
jgi:hypothetical protein